MKSTHYFLGVPVKNIIIKERLLENRKKLQQQMDYKVWTAPEDFHLTLRFLGEVEDIEYWKEKVAGASAFPPFDLEIGEVGFFGNPQHPRVVFQSVSHSEELQRLFNYFQEGEAGRFHPHITLAKKWRKGELPEIESGSSLSWDVDTCTLFKVHPGSIPKYEPVTSVTLKGQVKRWHN
ncbi:RNA 2',3'-cyclic phosphodiesterase [Salimicrobium jeotgali]|uniref:RNA 2',3'-cyclic phosphodiesterase n=1 Tax=Salimicrobium jeotgali TaxID=1230341 RepID=UPI000C82F389|nr:RNA 2',3'-cyclic phosphodiesterase [Salimicrobium jeotgali]